jgi:hypothetical protein
MKRSLKAMLSMLAAVTMIGLSTTADATTAVLLSREELVHKSMAVVRVAVGRSYTAESEDGASIVTRTELTVKRLLKGSSVEEKVLIEQVGGTYNGKTQRLLGDARLTPGEDAVVFLRSGKGGRWNFTALALSVYHVDEKGLARRSLDGLNLVKRSSGRLVALSAVQEDAEPVEALMTDVVRIAGGK